jgi:hypothetical protein
MVGLASAAAQFIIAVLILLQLLLLLLLQKPYMYMLQTSDLFSHRTGAVLVRPCHYPLCSSGMLTSFCFPSTILDLNQHLVEPMRALGNPVVFCFFLKKKIVVLIVC